MTLNDYIQSLIEFRDEHDRFAEFQVITSTDDEGNGFNLINFPPSYGYFEDGEFTNTNPSDEYANDPNSICVN